MVDENIEIYIIYQKTTFPLYALRKKIFKHFEIKIKIPK